VHDVQVAPPLPHEEMVSDVSHVPAAPPTQHPVGQLLLSQEHVPLVVSQTPFEQLAHRPPWLPQLEAVSLASTTHAPPATAVQQPAGHEFASQTHAPVVALHS
jgi:hypothetical protein